MGFIIVFGGGIGFIFLMVVIGMLVEGDREGLRALAEKEF